LSKCPTSLRPLELLMYFFDLAGLKAARANRHLGDFAVDAGADVAQIRIETAVGHVVGVGDVMTKHRFLSAVFANS